MEAPTTRETLLRRFRTEADPLAWEEFYRLYEPLVRRYVRRFGLQDYDVDDLVQELFIKLRTQLARFDLDLAKGRFRAWLRTVVDNTVRDALDRVGRRADPTLRQPSSMGQAGEPDKGDDTDRWRRMQWRQDVLTIVMERVRKEFEARATTLACFEQVTLQGRPARDVAAELGIEKVNNVYVYSHRVLQRVRDLCTEYDEDLEEGP